MSRVLHSSELILRPSGAIYHLNLFPEQIADTIVIVGDPDRVPRVSKHFDRVDHVVQTREFVTHTGELNGKRLSVVSSGIGTDNIDILLNELDALFNICFAKRQINPKPKKLKIIRIGSCGSLQEEIPVNSFVFSEYAIGLDGLLRYYPFEEVGDCADLQKAFVKQCQWPSTLASPYVVKADTKLIAKFKNKFTPGITVTASGFYAPQGRYLRNQGNNHLQNFLLTKMLWQGKKLTNYEMETSGIYGLSQIMGHQAITVCAVLANRVSGDFAINPDYTLKKLIKKVLEEITS